MMGKKYKVAIDAGHGSNTAGKRSPDGYKEHWINVMCANYLNIALKRCGIETVKIAWDDTNSTDDSDVPLSTRQRTVKQEKCDISVSIHANAHGNGIEFTSGEGIETFIYSSTSYAKDSKRLANLVQSYLIQGTKQKNRGVKTNKLAMCNCVAMGTKASILVELGFMTNKYELGLLKDDNFSLECAEEIAKGICEYLSVTYVINTTNLSPITSSIYTRDKFIKDIQSAIGVKVNGIIDNNTLSSLPTVSKSKNNKHKVIKPLQQYLNAIGYECGIADGIAGNKFDIAAKKWAKDFNRHFTKKDNRDGK